MKKLIILVILVTFSLFLKAQTDSRSNNVPNLIGFQGRLSDDIGDAINETVNITFSIYGVETGGTALWSETKAVNVIDGLFSVTLGNITPLDEDDFNSAERWIGILVETDSEMTPRTRITAVPYALQAGTGAPDGDWTISGSDIYNDTSYVGIGTNTPTNMLHIEGATFDPLVYINKTGPGRGLKVRANFACAIWVEYTGNNGLRVSQALGDGILIEHVLEDGLEVTQADGDGIHITNANDDGIEVENAGGFAGKFNGDGYFSGKLGLGTNDPQRTLHVNDYMRLEPVSDPPDTSSAGDIYFDLEDGMLKCYDGTTWQDCW